MSTPSYFIVGTDTNCGKTYVTVKLIDYFRQQNISALAIKPVASGADWVNNQLVNEDVVQLQIANQASPAPICRWLMPDPLSPHLAAKKNGDTIKCS